MNEAGLKQGRWNRDYIRWLMWIMLMIAFYLLDFSKIAFFNRSLWVAAITMINFAFVFAFYLLRDKTPHDDKPSLSEETQKSQDDDSKQ